jgi:alkylation response protein AidB-like acyl-CoA dehydrogenase
MPATEASSGFGLTADQREILEQVDRFARIELYPLQQRMDDEEWWPEHVFPLFGDNGYLGVMAPTELGGRGSASSPPGSSCRRSRGGIPRSRSRSSCTRTSA